MKNNTHTQFILCIFILNKIVVLLKFISIKSDALLLYIFVSIKKQAS